MRRLAWYTAMALATLAGIFLVWQFRVAVILFVLSLAVASVLRPMVDALASHRIPRGWALTITYVVVVIFIAGLLLFIGGPILAEGQGIAHDLPKAYESLQAAWLKGSWLQHTIAASFPKYNDLVRSFSGSESAVFFQSVLSITQRTLEWGSDIIIVFFLSIYWSADEDHFKRLWLSLLPSKIRTRSREMWQTLDKEVGAYLRSELIQAVLTLILLSIGYQVIGLKYPLLLAFFGALSWLIVWFGGFAATVVAFFAGFMLSLLTGVATGLFTVAVLAFLEFIVQPRLLNHAWISSLLLLIMVLFMVSEYGIIGFIFAPPLAAVVQILGRQLIFAPPAPTVSIEAPPVVLIDVLRERLSGIEVNLSRNSESARPEIQSLVERLDQLLDHAKQEEPFTD